MSPSFEILLPLLAQSDTGASLLDPKLIAPLLAAVAIGAVVYFLFTLMGGAEDKARERLEKFSRTRPVGGDADRGTGSERLQELLEKAAPALSKPLMSENEQELGELRLRLLNAGWRSESAPMMYNMFRLVAIVVGLVLAGAIIVPFKGFTRDGLMYSVILIGICFYIPTIVLSMRIKGRQEQIFFGLPDALDLMVVCVEAGLGLDAAMRKVCEEMNRSYPIIAEEFSICNFQIQMGRPRREVLHDLGIRTGVDDMKSLAAILTQADRFGSSIGQALRTQSDAMRVRRRQQAEERAAKTAVQLIIPLVMFIFPAIFVVLVGPAGIQIAENLAK